MGRVWGVLEVGGRGGFFFLGGFAVLAAGEGWCDSFLHLSSLVSQSGEGSLWITTVPDTTLKPCKLQRRRMKPKLQR